MYLLLGPLVHALVALAVRDDSDTVPGEYVFVHLADPQLGMLNQFGDKNFSQEEAMAKGLANMATKIIPKPQFLFLGGDMQNEWPESQAAYAILKKPEDAHKQREAVKSLLSVVNDASIPIVCTPGNHDVGDEPTKEDLQGYDANWHDRCTPQNLATFEENKTSGASSWTVGHVKYLQIDSQLYYTAKPELNDARFAQTSWLDDTVTSLDSSIQRIVVLTHIPPFMEQPSEPHGWANWDTDLRAEVLSILKKANKPVMWVCGHFHTNVINDEHNIRVTSAAGTTMWWDATKGGDLTGGHMSATDAAGVAGMPVAQAFCERIIGQTYNTTKKACMGFDKNKFDERMQPVPGRSGIRIFHVKTDGTNVKDGWFTLKRLMELHNQKESLSMSDLGLAF